MKLKIQFLAILLLPFLVRAQQPDPADSAKRLVDTVLIFSKKNSMYRNKVNWTKLEDSVRIKSSRAKTIKEVIPAIKYLFESLGDHHAFITEGRRYHYGNFPKKKLDTAIYRNLLLKLKEKNTEAVALMLENDYGYLLVPRNNPTRKGDNERLCKALQDSLCKLKPGELKGLILDLRLNSGGNMNPMIAGLAGLLAEGKLGTFMDPVTKTGETWSLRNHGIYSNDDREFEITGTCKGNPALKLVILIGPVTASSGEVTAISFKGRKNTWFIGENTAGYTTANISFQFNNQIGVFLSNSVEADRNGRLYEAFVSPDEFVEGGDNFDDLHKDNKIIAALKWLKSKKH
eukprot:gene11855-13818_t